MGKTCYSINIQKSKFKVINLNGPTDELDNRINLPCALFWKVVIRFFTCKHVSGQN